MQIEADAKDSTRERAWTAYWRSGALHSCIGSFDDGYGGVIGEHWADVFGRVPPQARVIDIATGNGALPRLLVMRSPDMAVEAVDLAGVKPLWFDAARYPNLHFHAGVRMEHLPYEDGRFHLVTSQFGIEYGQRPASLDEALRVLHPDGTMALVMHHRDGVLARVAAEEVANAQWLLSQEAPLAAVREALPWMARARAGEHVAIHPEAGQARQYFNAAMRAAQARAGTASVPDLLVQLTQWSHWLMGTVSPERLDEMLQAVDDARSGLQEAMLRSEELVSHALDQAQAGALAEHLRQARPNAQVTLQVLSQSQGVLGWWLMLAPGR